MKAKISLVILLFIMVVFYFFFTGKNISNLQQDAVNINIDYIKIIKSERKIYTYNNSRLLKVYNMALGGNSIGQKEREGDRKTPEGIYEIIAKNPKSNYHLSLKISYPNESQIDNAKKSSINLGGDIMIHGIRNGLGFVGKYHALLDWTQGCVAVTNEEIDEIYNLTSIGTKVEILP